MPSNGQSVLLLVLGDMDEWLVGWLFCSCRTGKAIINHPS